MNYIIFVLFCMKEISDSIEFIAASTGRSKTTFTQERKEKKNKRVFKKKNYSYHMQSKIESLYSPLL